MRRKNLHPKYRKKSSEKFDLKIYFLCITKLNKMSQEDNELSYEEEQIQHILLQESEKKRIEMERELKRSQEKEYESGLQQDMQNMNISPIDKLFDEPSVEEMRRVRLIRFGGYQLVKD
mgnify:CR=1 FL=1